MTWVRKIFKKKEFNYAEQELAILKDEIISAKKFLKKNRKSHFGGKKTVPLYLLLGPPHFGKTTLLSKSGLNLKNTKHQAFTSIVPTKYCSFWFSHDAIYIDTAGIYTKPEVAKQCNDLIWQGFIKLLQKYFGKYHIAGVLTIIDLPAVTGDNNLFNKTLLCLKERIYELASIYVTKSIPVHVIFTKCDRILGFTDFFSKLSVDGYKKPFGITFSSYNERTDPVRVFEEKFDKLLHQLNDQVITYLHENNKIENCYAIKKFPSQFEMLRQTLFEVLSKIPSGRKILFLGTYFTSSVQDGTPIDLIKNSIFKALELKEKPAYVLETVNRHSYFIEDIFKKIITTPVLSAQAYLRLNRIPFDYLYSPLIITLIVSVALLICYKNYNKNIEHLGNIKQFLKTQSEPIDLDNLSVFLTKITKVSESLWLKLGTNETRSIATKLQQLYKVSLAQLLDLQLKSSINTEINLLLPNSDPKMLYSSLKAYLMLGDPKRFDKNYVKSWFTEYWIKTYKDSNVRKHRLEKIDTILLSLPKLELDKQLVVMARNKLQGFSDSKLIYLLLENSFTNDITDLGCGKFIAKLYTSEYFNKFYNDEKIYQAIKNLSQEDWVLGEQIKFNSTAFIGSEIKKLYLERYIAAWSSVIGYEPKIEFNNLNQAASVLASLAAKNSPFINLLQQIKNNTKISGAPAVFSQELSRKLYGIDNVDLTNLQKYLENLSIYLTKISQSSDPDKAAFDAVATYLQGQNNQHDQLLAVKNFANTQVPFVHNFLSELVNKSLSCMLDAASKHISKMWTVAVIPQYQKMLVNKYPIFKDRQEDMSLNDFNKFFGPYGLMDWFFNKYIKQFVDISKNNWVWKSIDGQKINLSHSSLETFLRAALIQKMFYATDDLNPKLRFSLAPINMTTNTRSFTMHIDGQRVAFNELSKDAVQLVWPGPNPGVVTVDFIDTTGKYSSMSQFGPWAWFRIIDKSNIVTSGDNRRFELIFDLNGNAVRYWVISSESVNPFIPEIISNFRCPEQLT